MNYFPKFRKLAAVLFRNSRKTGMRKIAVAWIFFLLLSGVSRTVLGQYVRDSLRNQSAAAEPETGESADFTSRLVPGGNFGLGFGSQWYIDLSPSLGYQLNKNMVAGAGIIYNAYGGTIAGQKVSYQRYGGFGFARHRLYQSFFANCELELLNVPVETYSEETRKWVFSPLAGASYIMPFGTRGGLQISLLYNLNYNPVWSPYPSPYVWRIGFFL